MQYFLCEKSRWKSPAAIRRAEAEAEFRLISNKQKRRHQAGVWCIDKRLAGKDKKICISHYHCESIMRSTAQQRVSKKYFILLSS